MRRRQFIKGLIAAPVVITTPGLLMPVKKLVTPDYYLGPDINSVDIHLKFPYEKWKEWVISQEAKIQIRKGGF